MGELNMVERAVEAFRWYRDDFKTTSQVGNKIRIKGKAIFPTISGNNRKYVDEELIRSARTLAGKEIDVNHEIDLWERAKESYEAIGRKFDEAPPKKKGHVFDADYEDGVVEYVAEINHPEYVQKLLDRQAIIDGKMTRESYRSKWGKEPIYGVSISAYYRYSESNSNTSTPRGLFFQRLSIVEDPEKPGVSGTTISVMETLHEKSVEEASAVALLIRETAPTEMYEEYSREVLQKMTGTKIRNDNPHELGVFDAKSRVEEKKVEEVKPENPIAAPIVEVVKVEEKPTVAPATDPIDEKMIAIEKQAEIEKRSVEAKTFLTKVDALVEAMRNAGGEIKVISEKVESGKAEADAKAKAIQETIDRLTAENASLRQDVGMKAGADDVKRITETQDRVAKAIGLLPDFIVEVKGKMVALETEDKRVLESAVLQLNGYKETFPALVDEKIKAVSDAYEKRIVEMEGKLKASEDERKKLVDDLAKAILVETKVNALSETLDGLKMKISPAFKDKPEPVTQKPTKDFYPEKEKRGIG